MELSFLYIQCPPTSRTKAQNNFHKQRLKETNALAPASLRKSFWILFWLCSGSGGQFMSIFSSFFQKCCRLNFAPNNLDSVPLHFLDEPLSSIMTNYGTWWYVTRTSPPKAVEEKKKAERNISGKKITFFLFICIRNCRWWNTTINHDVGFPSVSIHLRQHIEDTNSYFACGAM